MTYPLSANGALYDKAAVENYFKHLFRNVDWEEGQLVSILGIGEKGTDQEGKFRERKIVAPAFIGAVHAHLQRWAAHEVAGFAVPAVLRAEAAEAGDVTLDKVAALTALLLDIDSGDTEAKRKWISERLGDPTMVVASGGTTDEGTPKLHLYWLFDEPCEDVERVAAVRKTLAAKVGGDQAFGRATQVVRIAGTVHAKNSKPSVCRLLEEHPFDYSFEDLAETVEDMLPMPGIEPPKPKAEAPLVDGMMDFAPKHDTAIDALHRDIDAGGDDLNRWGEFNKVAGFYIAEARAGRLTPEAAREAANGWMLEHMNPPWPQQRFDTEFAALVQKDFANHGPLSPVVAVQQQAMVAPPLKPTPADFPYHQTIPPRPWLFGRWFMRGIVTAVIAPGGIGKSSLMASVALSCVTGRELLGKRVYGGPLRVWLWNLEDSGDNLARARVAASMHHRVKAEECGDRLFVDSGPEGATLCTAVEDKTSFTIIEPVMANVTAALKEAQIDVLVVDPFVSSHQVNENDNNKIDAVAKRWARVAIEANCSIVLVHHTAKLHGEKVTADSARGAGALNNAARMTLVLNRMTSEQADTLGVEEDRARSFFNVVDDKHNLSAPEAADWFELVSVDLQNRNDLYESDKVGVVTRWNPPRVTDGVDVDHLIEIQNVLHRGTFWRDPQSKTCSACDVVAQITGLPSETAQHKRRLVKLLNTWIKSGALKIVSERDEKTRKMREAITVGSWVAPQNTNPTEGNANG